MNRHTGHPFLYSLLISPFGIVSGFNTVALVHIASRPENGFDEMQAASLITAGMLPHTYSFPGNSGAYAAEVPTGTYDVWLTLSDTSSTADETNTDAMLVATGRAVTADTSLDLEAVVYAVSGTVAYDGATPPAYSTSDYTVTFSDGTIAYSFPGNSGTYAAELPEGTYEVWLVLSDTSSTPDETNTGLLPVGECLAVGP